MKQVFGGVAIILGPWRGWTLSLNNEEKNAPLPKRVYGKTRLFWEVLPLDESKVKGITLLMIFGEKQKQKTGKSNPEKTWKKRN